MLPSAHLLDACKSGATAEGAGRGRGNVGVLANRHVESSALRGAPLATRSDKLVDQMLCGYVEASLFHSTVGGATMATCHHGTSPP